jgi:AcrR family transcriptional regulator
MSVLIKLDVNVNMTSTFNSSGFSRVSTVHKKARNLPSNPPVAEPVREDHRVRTGAFRREQTRRRLLATAMRVFAEKGADAPLIDDFIAAAGVARGTFYNHFSTTQELLDAVTAELSDTILAEIDKVVVTIKDPLERLATGCLLYMYIGVDLPNWGAFVMRTGFRSQAIGNLVDVYMPRDIELARHAGEIAYPTLRAARDLMFGCVNQAILTVIAAQAPREHLRHMLALGLRGVGAKPALADRMSQLELPVVPLPDLHLDGKAA